MSWDLLTFKTLSQGCGAGVDYFKVSSEGYFRPESPWLPGTRKVNLEADPVELTSYVSRPRGDSETYIKVKEMSASWSSEDDNTVLKGISFELDKVCHNDISPTVILILFLHRPLHFWELWDQLELEKFVLLYCYS